MVYETRVRIYLCCIIFFVLALSTGHIIRQVGSPEVPLVDNAIEARLEHGYTYNFDIPPDPIEIIEIDMRDDTSYHPQPSDESLPEVVTISVEHENEYELHDDDTEAEELFFIHNHRVTPLGHFDVTAYCICVICTEMWSYEHPDNTNGMDFVQRTASGTIPTPGRTIAVDTSLIPFGSHVYITGLGWRVAEDRGGAIRNNRLDVLKSCHDAAIEWGIRSLEVFVRN